ncbi:MAG TPA: C40 family peptidase [Gemmatimonadales bacterium]|nr:C40 family peptidase [Gemmatimonadales bacterium]
MPGLRGGTVVRDAGEPALLTRVIARSAVVPLFAQPSFRSEQVSQLVLGETGWIDERAGQWRRLRVDLDGYQGWVHEGYCVETEDEIADRWRQDAGMWSLGATVGIDGRRVALPLRARVAMASAEVRLPDGRSGVLLEGEVAPAPAVASAARAQPVERWALARFEGAPYEWGGVTPWGVDCSGLVQTAFAARGIPLPRDAELQVECGAVVDLDASRPGDLLFFRGESGDRITHVAFAAGEDSLVHSTVACGGVLVESWLPGTRAGSLRDRLVAVRRLEAR